MTIIYGTEQDDFLFNFGGNNTVYGYSGNDVFAESDDIVSNDFYFGGNGNDLINSISGNDTIKAGKGDDIVVISDTLRELHVFGGKGYDVLYIERDLHPHPMKAFINEFRGFEEIHYF